MRQAAQFNIPLQTLVFQALRQLIQTTPLSISQWSDVILSYDDMPDFPAFESYRNELLPPHALELF